MEQVEITIDGLTERQKVFADILWAFETEAQIDQFIASLPSKALRNEVNSVKTLIVMAVRESNVDSASQQEAQSLLKKFNR
jgi:hypothetical protein